MCVASEQTSTQQADFTNGVSESRAETLPLSKQEGENSVGAKMTQREMKQDYIKLCCENLLANHTVTTGVHRGQWGQQ